MGLIGMLIIIVLILAAAALVIASADACVDTVFIRRYDAYGRVRWSPFWISPARGLPSRSPG
jgi:hypothetical protein